VLIFVFGAVCTDRAYCKERDELTLLPTWAAGKVAQQE